MSLYSSLPFRHVARLGAAGCALALSFCGGLPEDEVTPPPAPQTAALGSGPIRYEGQGPFLGTTVTNLPVNDPTHATPKLTASGCDGSLVNPSLACDRGGNHWLPRLAPGR